MHRKVHFFIILSQNTDMDHVLKKRTLYFFTVICSLFTMMTLKLYSITQSETLCHRIEKYHYKTELLANERPTIYDRNGVALTNRDHKTTAIIFGGADNLNTLKNYFSNDKFSYLLNTVNRQGYVMTDISDLASNQMSVKIDNTNRYCENGLCSHIIGYMSDNTGVSGLEAALERYFAKNSRRTYVTFQADALGNPIIPLNVDIYIDGGTKGVTLTIDSRLQSIVQTQLSENVVSGSACIIDPENGQILACASNPTFDANNIAKSLNEPYSPFVNKAFATYSVGSVFKPVIAAAVIESGYDSNAHYTCTGSIRVGDTVYRCHKAEGHGSIDLKDAIALSCNCYFVKLAEVINCEYLLSFLSNCGFGREISFLSDYSASAGNLPTVIQLQNGDLQNICFGQGKLQANILQISSFMAAVINNGVYRTPELILDISSYQEKPVKQHQFKIMSSETALFLKQSMIDVITRGTGHRAKPDRGIAGGKTATAQTGVYINGTEQNHGWFSGFYEYGDDSYIITVFAENGGEGSQTPAVVFKNICDNISYLTNR